MRELILQDIDRIAGLNQNFTTEFWKDFVIVSDKIADFYKHPGFNGMPDELLLLSYREIIIQFSRNNLSFTLDYVLSNLSDKKHQLIEVPTLKYYSIYNNRVNQGVICNELEKHGYSVRVGLRHNYAGRQGLQVIVFELSKNMFFKHRFTSDYMHQIQEDSNLLPGGR